MGVEGGDRVEERLEGEGVEFYEEYTGFRVGMLRRMQETGPISKDQLGMPPGMEEFFPIMLFCISIRHRFQFLRADGCLDVERMVREVLRYCIQII